ncbi:MAG: ribosome silencing factor [Acidobacteria bacterium]|nr:ribosome silencing factor [Acidobacteriota bacterium]MCZ6728044.1 ribosome silencing factor [Acidobacteriota bacterium]
MRATATRPPDIRLRLRHAVAVADDRKALDLKVLWLADVSDFTDYFMVCSGRSARQVQAISDGIVRELRDQGVRPQHVEGARLARWVLLDYGDMVIHVFDVEARDYYRLERLWADAPDVTAELRG